jgi:hypothetical protein
MNIEEMTMNITEKMIEFHKIADTSIFNVKNNYSKVDCWAVCIELFSWLKLEHKRYIWSQEGRPTKSKPHKLDPDAFFTKVIPDFIDNDEVFKHTFKISGDMLYYSDEITEEEIRTITKMAFDYYNPEPTYN